MDVGLATGSQHVQHLESSLGGDPADTWDYHKRLFPVDKMDIISIVCAGAGLSIAASGGVGGGGMLVPIFILLLGFHAKHAIALANFTIFGGAIANTWLNAPKKHPQRNLPLIDWDLVVIMEPLTIFGAVFGSLLSKVLPNIFLTLSLVLLLGYTGHRTMKKGVLMWNQEGRVREEAQPLDTDLNPAPCDQPLGGEAVSPATLDVDVDRPYLDLEETECQATPATASETTVETTAEPQNGTRSKVQGLTLCFAGIVLLTVLRGGGQFPSPLGVSCGGAGFWWLYFSCLPWVLGFAVYFRSMLVADYESKVQTGYSFTEGEIKWTPRNTVVYPLICALAGLCAGLFGVGGGIVKGPLMLEMGVVPAVASATSAAMILFTSAAASVSFVVFGLLQVEYAALFFLLGFTVTATSQVYVTRWVSRNNRQSPIVLSIGVVVSLSAVLMAINTVVMAAGKSGYELVKPHGVCSAS
uniref:Uncharacterized protein n=1 Tax=Noctiluca scintillans TaxID=2966 RepID=A0A7S1AV26_NOCSC